MLFILIITVIFVMVSVYFYFRSERLQHDLVKLRRETSQTRKDNKALTDAMALSAAKHEEFYQFRLKKLLEIAEKKSSANKSDLELISPLISNYANLYRVCLSQKDQLKAAVEKCCESYKKGSFKEFLRFISGQEKHIKRMWSSNNLNGFLSLVEALLIEQHSQLDAIAIKKNN